MSFATIGANTTISHGVTTVDCQKQVRSWRLLRSLMELLIPSCNCTFLEEQGTKEQNQNYNYHHRQLQFHSFTSCSTMITGTIFGFRRGKVNFCIQTSSKSTTNNNPILLLELAVHTTTLAKEMQGGILRIALECNKVDSQSLLSMPLWTMYCNGRKVGYAVKRKPLKSDLDALKLMSSVVAGAGIINGKELDSDDQLMYLRANFQRNCGSPNSESFHLIDPDGNLGQELSIFFFCSQ